MNIRSAVRQIPLALALCLIGTVEALCANSASGGGTITVLVSFAGQGYGNSPGQLLEVSPGLFVGMTTGGATAFLLSNQGAVTPFYTFPSGIGPAQTFVQAVNGGLYGQEPHVNFNLSLTGAIQTYSAPTENAPVLAVQLPDGTFYGTQASNNGENTFVRMTLGGKYAILHSFAVSEGIPYGLPILGSDGNFYGISGLGQGNNSTSAIVYRMTPKGTLTTFATYPDGRQNYGVGSFKEYLIQASDGNFYGTAALGGSKKAGAIFKVSPTGSYTTLHEFTDLATGAPGFLIEGSDGNLYGAAQGVTSLGGGSSVFRISLSGNFHRLQILNGNTVGTCPCWLALGSDGKFYGTASSQGGSGSAFVWDLGLPPPKPKVTGVVPTSGAPGAVVTVNGKFLLGATAVSFNGTPATTFSNISGTYVSVTVPTGATSGPITVTTANGSSTSTGSFTVE